MMFVINMFGVPGSGKSTSSAYIFSNLKMAGVDAELITEAAKDKVWEKNTEVFKPDNQLYLFGEQFYRMSRCRDKVDVLITDSPLLLNALYNESDTLGEVFDQLVANVFNSFDNLNYLLIREQPYKQKGRIHTEAQADALHEPLVELLKKHCEGYVTLKGNQYNYNRIVNDALEKLGMF